MYNAPASLEIQAEKYENEISLTVPGMIAQLQYTNVSPKKNAHNLLPTSTTCLLFFFLYFFLLRRMGKNKA